jgi:hypothetical protein
MGCSASKKRVFRIFVKFINGGFYRNLSRKCEFLENLLNDTHTLVRGEKDFLSIFCLSIVVKFVLKDFYAPLTRIVRFVALKFILHE